MSTEQKPNVYMAERHINPEVLAAMRRRENFTWAAVLAILATIFFIALVVLQWLDFSQLSVA